MKRRSEASGHGAVPQRPSESKFKHRGAANATGEPSSVAPHQEQIVRLTRELEDAREQQAATSEVLRALSQSEFQLQSRARIAPGQGTVIGRAAMTGEVARIDDVLTDPLYEKKEDAKVEGNLDWRSTDARWQGCRCDRYGTAPARSVWRA
jgi:hypothetical protein